MEKDSGERISLAAPFVLVVMSALLELFSVAPRAFVHEVAVVRLHPRSKA